MPDSAELERQSRNLIAFATSIGRPFKDLRWPYRGSTPPAEWLQWRHAATCAKRVLLYMNSGIMDENEVAYFGALCLEYRTQARRLWRAWLKVKPAFDRSRRHVN